MDKDSVDEIVKLGQMAGQSFDIELSVNYNNKQYFSEKTSCNRQGFLPGRRKNDYEE